MARARGLTDFLHLFGDEEPCFALVAYRGGPGMATAIIADTYGPAGIVEAAEVRLADGGQPVDLIAVIDVRDSEWTVVLHAVGRVGADQLVALPDEALDLSETLGTEALVLSASDGSAGYELYREGELIERATWGAGDGYSHFESARGGQRLEAVEGLGPAAPLAEELGLDVPRCRPRGDEKATWLAADDPLSIARVDLLDMAGHQLVTDEVIHEASTDAFPRPSAEMLRRARVDAGEASAPEPASLRGVLLRWVGKVLGE